MPGAHRAIRKIDAGEGPYAGTLVTRDGSVAVQVDAEAISGWAGWEHAGDDHVAAPLDIVRRSDGHDVLLPWCTERVSAFFGRRAAAGAVLAAGETTTLVASILRGLGELTRAEGQEETGEWWLTDDGRPIFVIGAGETARAATAGLVARLRRDSADRALTRLLIVVEEGLRADTARPGMPARQLEKWEAELCDTAAPKPLRRDVHAPELARDVDAAGRAVVVRPDARSRLRSRGSLPRGAGGVVALSTRFDARLVHRLGDWRAALVRRIERRTRRSGVGVPIRREKAADVNAAAPDGRDPVRRGRRTIVAAAAAAVVLAGGLLWPGGATGEPDGRGPTAVPESTPRASDVDRLTADPSTTSSPSSPEPDQVPDAVTRGEGSPRDGSESADPVEAAQALIGAISICAENDDKVCDGAVAQGSTAVVDALGGGRGEALQLEPVDEYGDVAVIRASPPHGRVDGAVADDGERMVVLVRVAEKWLVRDVYDVADQPG